MPAFVPPVASMSLIGAEKFCACKAIRPPAEVARGVDDEVGDESVLLAAPRLFDNPARFVDELGMPKPKLLEPALSVGKDMPD
ncbi:hypothetical protein FHX57_001981 [Paraburkholderia tropica]|uniref:hypothetical protein n=1 Tax=Paraburkholderia tropica TaxID=92647 RepID=UPI0016134AB0|nr:hypothetical protein [Paraburkholderia tropica]MBB2999650.1 hypothetical protein [Paraburkholderia tropica]